MAALASDVFIVDEIRAAQRHGRSVFYLVKWRGYGEHQLTWEPQRNILDKKLVADYENVKAWKWEFQGNDKDAKNGMKAGEWYACSKDVEAALTNHYTAWLEDYKRPSVVSVTRTRVVGGRVSVWDYQVEFSTQILQTNKKNKTVRPLRRIPI